jgi:hypothetical protein
MMRWDIPEPEEPMSPSYDAEIAEPQARSPVTPDLHPVNPIDFVRNWRSSPLPRRSVISVDSGHAIVNCQQWPTSG